MGEQREEDHFLMGHLATLLSKNWVTLFQSLSSHTLDKNKPRCWACQASAVLFFSGSEWTSGYISGAIQMKRNVILAMLVFTLGVIVLVGVLFGGNPFTFNKGNPSPQPPTTATNPISRENAQMGTDAWQIPPGKAASTQIQAYAGATSVMPGQKLTFYVSTQVDTTAYSVEIYRLGWYEGAGGRLMASQLDIAGHAQGYYDANQNRLIGCTSCHIDAKTHLIEANWQPSYVLTIPTGWTTGIYLAKFIDVNGFQTYVPFDVRGNDHSAYVVVTPDTTYAAYDTWGGASLYKLDDSVPGEDTNAARATKVSFDRPYLEGDGSSQVLLYEVDAIHWWERQGYDISYISDVDLHENPAQLLNHKAYISLGHDEYWTKEMRDGVESARDHGVGLAFLGANASYWQMRFEPDSAGTPDRTVVCYKVQSFPNTLANDPLYGKDNTRVTAQWRDPVLDRPENAMIGIMYSGFTHQQQGFPWVLGAQANAPFVAGTGLQPGQQYGCDVVGYEWDRVFKNGAGPANLQVLATSTTKTQDGVADVSNTTYYIAASHALVFATGSIYWTESLDDYRFVGDASCPQQNSGVPGMQQLMANIMNALITPQALPGRVFASTKLSLASSMKLALDAMFADSCLRRRMTRAS
jgi:hypothetical protein